MFILPLLYVLHSCFTVVLAVECTLCTVESGCTVDFILSNEPDCTLPTYVCPANYPYVWTHATFENKGCYQTQAQQTAGTDQSSDSWCAFSKYKDDTNVASQLAVGGSLCQDGTLYFASFTLDTAASTGTFLIPAGVNIMKIAGAFTVGGGMTVTVEEKLSITANVVTVEKFATISGNGQGFGEESGPGYLEPSDQYEYVVSLAAAKVGGSHGGRGGTQADIKFGEKGSAYGNYKFPVTQGSGGRRGTAGGGAGGAALKIVATVSMTVEGSISMDGTGKPCASQGCVGGGGGSGGSVWIDAATFSGTGSITTDGGQSTRGYVNLLYIYSIPSFPTC